MGTRADTTATEYEIGVPERRGRVRIRTLALYSREHTSGRRCLPMGLHGNSANECSRDPALPGQVQRTGRPYKELRTKDGALTMAKSAPGSIPPDDHQHQRGFFNAPGPPTAIAEAVLFG